MKAARQRYKGDLNAKKKLDLAVHSKENNDNEVQKLIEKIGLINEQIQLKKSGFVVAEDCIAEGKQNFKNVLSNT